MSSEFRNASTTANPAAPATAWTAPELTNPHQSAEKATKVRGMFSAIAGTYDLNNRVHSAWQDQRWRRKAVRAANVNPGDHVLDVACGTGDLTQLFAKSPAEKVIGLDFTPAMLDIARTKLTRQPADAASKVSYMEGDAMALPFSDASFDVLSIAFGIRNVTDPSKALAEFARVLKPRGRLVVLEFDQPSNPVMRWFNRIYCASIMPRTATAISGDKSGAYRYLPASVGTFWTSPQMQQALAKAGFADISTTTMTLGICTCYRALRA
jgi:demethylmenaquinone methyltransferase/2-methoxy-6-polyprenyl-1,4-benzoquinol methylase